MKGCLSRLVGQIPARMTPHSSTQLLLRFSRGRVPLRLMMPIVLTTTIRSTNLMNGAILVRFELQPLRHEFATVTWGTLVV